MIYAVPKTDSCFLKMCMCQAWKLRPNLLVYKALIGLVILALNCLHISNSESSEVYVLPAKVVFNEHIRPILTKHCVACHGGVKQAADFSFVYPETVVSPEGYVITSGNADESSLVERIKSDDPELRMPPPEHGAALTVNEIALLMKWIDQGANWQEHWSLVAPQPTAVPSVRNAKWCNSAIDKFILARLEQEDIQPSPNARPERWLRRVSFDLIGLPPTPTELASFQRELQSIGEPAYARVVDRLLDSPHFGERWAAVWLDQVRYADSRGLGYDLPRNAWKYRDWVIGALNNDIPYDLFTIKQIAGDLLPQPTMEDHIATACHRLSQSNDEGGTDDEEFRVEAVLERVDTTWLAWSGISFGCARCHDHPYEPFRQEEYYKFAAFFNNTRDSDLYEDYPLKQVPIEKQDYDRAQQLDTEINILKSLIWNREQQLANDTNAWSDVELLSVGTNNSTKVEIQQSRGRTVFRTAGTIEGNTDITLDFLPPKSVKELTAFKIACLPGNPTMALSDSEWGFVLSHVKASLLYDGKNIDLKLVHVVGDEFDPFIDPQESLNPRSRSGFSAYTRINHPRSVVFILEKPILLPENARLSVVLAHRKQVLASFSLTTRHGYVEVSNDQRFPQLLSDAKRAAQLDQLSHLVAERRGINSTPLPVMQQRAPQLARPTHLFERGSQFSKGVQVSPGVPAAMPKLQFSDEADRLSLAQWLVSGEHPLTARVAVNRYWARLFGVGIVATEEDFGSTGEPPSHPLLLDFLANRFQSTHEWCFKPLLREIVLSSTYRQSAVVRADLAERDPNNRLLARGPRMQLPAEMVRDQALLSAGLLTDQLFGRPVYPPIPQGVWRPFSASDKWTTPPRGDVQRYRRSIYTYTKRSIPYPVSTSFDAPTREVCTPRRFRSNTPVQSLMKLNDETFVECTEVLASQMMESGNSPENQIEEGFLRVVSRLPTQRELEGLVHFFNSLPDEKTTKERLLLVASAILNLDEAATK